MQKSCLLFNISSNRLESCSLCSWNFKSLPIIKSNSPSPKREIDFLSSFIFFKEVSISNILIGFFSISFCSFSFLSSISKFIELLSISLYVLTLGFDIFSFPSFDIILLTCPKISQYFNVCA